MTVQHRVFRLVFTCTPQVCLHHVRLQQKCGGKLCQHTVPLAFLTHVTTIFHKQQFQTFVSFGVFYGWMIHRTAKVSEEVNRKFPSRNTMVQLSTAFCCSAECHNAPFDIIPTKPTKNKHLRSPSHQHNVNTQKLLCTCAMTLKSSWSHLSTISSWDSRLVCL